jgi:hypothetical protein
VFHNKKNMKKNKNMREKNKEIQRIYHLNNFKINLYIYILKIYILFVSIFLSRNNNLILLIKAFPC